MAKNKKIEPEKIEPTGQLFVEPLEKYYIPLCCRMRNSLF